MRLHLSQDSEWTPRPSRGAGLLALCFGLVAWGVCRPAAAAAGTPSPAPEEHGPQQEKLACSQSFELGQRLRNDTRYLEANEELLKCANPKCGDALLQECSRLYAEVQTAIPSVIFQARDSKTGQELLEVVVSLDGQTLADELDGKPVLVDPGNHTFTFAAAGAPPVEKSIVIRAGEKFRQVVVQLAIQEEQRREPTPIAKPKASANASHPARARRVPIASYVLGGVGAVALGTGVALRLVGSGDYHSLEVGCSPNCAQSDVDSVKQKYLISNVALGIGAAALAGAVVLYAVQPKESAKGETAFVIGPTNGGLWARALTRF